jgi:hypothetical protein
MIFEHFLERCVLLTYRLAAHASLNSRLRQFSAG